MHDYTTLPPSTLNIQGQVNIGSSHFMTLKEIKNKFTSKCHSPVISNSLGKDAFFLVILRQKEQPVNTPADVT